MRGMVQAQEGVLLCCRAWLCPTLRVYTGVCDKGLHAGVGGTCVSPQVCLYVQLWMPSAMRCLCRSGCVHASLRTHGWPGGARGRAGAVCTSGRAHGRCIAGSQRAAGCWWVGGCGVQGCLPPLLTPTPSWRQRAGTVRAEGEPGELMGSTSHPRPARSASINSHTEGAQKQRGSAPAQ